MLSQEHVSGRSAWQNMWVGFGGRITRDHRSILPPNPTSMFWQDDLPQTCSWFYLMLPCYLQHTECEKNIIKYSNLMWWSNPPCLGCSTLQGNSNTVISQTTFIPYRPLLNNILLLYICKKNGNIAQKIRKWDCLRLDGEVWLWPTYGKVFCKWLRTSLSNQ